MEKKNNILEFNTKRDFSKSILDIDLYEEDGITPNIRKSAMYEDPIYLTVADFAKNEGYKEKEVEMVLLQNNWIYENKTPRKLIKFKNLCKIQKSLLHFDSQQLKHLCDEELRPKIAAKSYYETIQEAKDDALYIAFRLHKLAMIGVNDARAKGKIPEDIDDSSIFVAIVEKFNPIASFEEMTDSESCGKTWGYLKYIFDLLNRFIPYIYDEEASGLIERYTKIHKYLTVQYSEK